MPEEASNIYSKRPENLIVYKKFFIDTKKFIKVKDI